MVDVPKEALFPADNHQVSGVREMPYSIDSELSFLRPGPNQNPDLFPLDFIRQIVSKPKNTGESNPEEAPWIFPQQSSGLVTRMVSAGVKKYPADGAALDQFRNFTLLQRLFKTAFEGGFGHHFPVEKLSEMAGATRTALHESQTPAWDFTFDGERRIKEQLPANQVNLYRQLYQTLNVDVARRQLDCLEPYATY